MQMQFGLLFALGLLTSSAWGCGGGAEGPGGPTVSPPPGNPTPAPQSNPAAGGPPGGLSAAPYDNQGFLAGGGGPVANGSALNCNFDSPCCWDNEVPPKDALNWVTATDPSGSSFNNVFPGKAPPSGKFLLTYSGRPESPDKEAQFYSCSIGCTRDDVRVTLRYWTTPGVVIQVCERDAFADNGKLLNCKTLPDAGQPGPTTVTLPPSEFFDIVIVARNFNQANSTAAIDDIKVDSRPCPEQTATPPAGGNLCCNFDAGNPCSYQDLRSQGGQGATQSWRVVRKIGNLDTGIQQPADGSAQFLGTELKPGERAVMKSENIRFSNPRELRMKYYEATKDIQFKTCVNDLTNCPLTSNKDVSQGDRQWKTGSVTLDQNVQNVYFVAENTGNNIGSVGVDQITAQVPGGGSGCPNTPQGFFDAAFDDARAAEGSEAQQNPESQQNPEAPEAPEAAAASA